MKIIWPFAILSFLLVSLPSALMAGDGLLPCESAVVMTDFDAALMMRVSDHFRENRDHARFMVRILALPDFSPGCGNGPAEWALTIFLLDDGSGLLELAEADESIRGKNSRWVRTSDGVKAAELTKRRFTVNLTRYSRGIDSDLAIRVHMYLRESVLSASFPKNDVISVSDNSSKYLFIVKRGFMICGQMDATGAPSSGNPLEELVRMLRTAAQAEGSDSIQNLRNLVSLLEEH